MKILYLQVLQHQNADFLTVQIFLVAGGIAGVFQTTCPVFIRDAIAIIDQLLAEYEKNPEK
jgi:hypothetical protein